MANETHESVIGSDVEIIGTLKSSGSIRLDGKLEGELLCGGNAVLGKNAQVKGNVTATSVSIEGKINGNILAKDKIEMKATATVGACGWCSISTRSTGSRFGSGWSRWPWCWVPST